MSVDVVYKGPEFKNPRNARNVLSAVIYNKFQLEQKKHHRNGAQKKKKTHAYSICALEGPSIYDYYRYSRTVKQIIHTT